MHCDVLAYGLKAWRAIALSGLQLGVNFICQNIDAHDANVLVYELVHVDCIHVIVECAEKACRVHPQLDVCVFYTCNGVSKKCKTQLLGDKLYKKAYVELHNMMLVSILLLPALVLAHDDSSQVGCCGDIPESLIWLLSLFILIGVLAVIGSYFWIPEPPPPMPQACSATNIRIDARDIDRLARALHKLNEDSHV
jgi:hypothetical protein